MEKIRTDLTTISNYARKHKITRPTVYAMIKRKELPTVVIDGITFIKLS